MYRFCITFCIVLVGLLGFSQNTEEFKAFRKGNITKPSILSTHSFGVYFSRLQGHFEMNAPQRKRVSVTLESGNVWSPPILVYIPKEEATRNGARAYQWDQAHRAYDESTIEKDSFSIKNDGITKGLRAKVNFKLAAQHELQVGFRVFMLTKGKLPFSVLTGDEFIEKFHTNVAGGDDPFDREVFGFNQAGFEYRDRNGNSTKVDSGELFASGIETNYYYYPKWLKNKSKTFAVNFGAHLGGNLSKANTSLDLGVSTNLIKSFTINEKRNFNIATSLGVLRKGLVDFKSDNLEFGTNDFIGYSETAIEYNFRSKGGTIHTFGTNFYVQTPLNEKAELDYIIPIRDPKAFNSWGHGATNLYKLTDYWTFVYSFTKKATIAFYLQQDFSVTNNPDLQAGINISYTINKRS